ncbi:DPP IV N-terminal domain-containing protein [Kribbella sp. NPDC051770]|uniref:S9 family peptidase n=1 Tax=Kribbella sp. NPDC051770 TaxID=3155413 RepID=UPI00343D5D8E
MKLDFQAAEALLRHNRSKLVEAGSISPQWVDDGFVYQVTRGGEEKTYRVDPTAGTRVEATGLPDRPGTGDFLAVVSPDGKYEVIRHGPDLWLRTVADGTERPLTTDGETDNAYGTNSFSVDVLLGKIGLPHLPPAVAWSPDSTRVLTHQLDRREVRETHLIDVLPEGEAAPELLTQRYAFPDDEHLPLQRYVVLDLDGGAVRAQGEPQYVGVLSPITLEWVWWSGGDVYFIEQPRDQRSLTMKRLDTRTGATEVILTETGDTRLEPNQYGQERAVTRAAGDDLLWYSQRDGRPHLYRYDLRTGELRNQVTSGEWNVRRILHVDDTVVCFTAVGLVAESPYRETLCRVHLDGTGFARITDDDLHHDVAVPPNGKYFVDTASTVDRPPVITVRSWTGEVLIELERADVTRLLATGWQPPEEFRALAADDVTEIFGLLHKPHGFDPAASYPVLNSPYPGPHVNRTAPSFDPGHFGPDAEALAALGFVVIAVDGRGTPGRTKAFHDASYRHLQTAGIVDHVAAIKQLAESRPWMDLDRVGVYGMSGGAFATVRAMGEFPGFFKAGVAESGNLDNRMYLQQWGETYAGPVGEQDYAEVSLLDLADRIEGRLLLVHGGLDDNVQPHHTLRFVERLIAADQDFDLLIVPRGEHVLLGYEHHVVRRRWNHLLQHVAGVTPPAYRLKPAEIDLAVIAKMFG